MLAYSALADQPAESPTIHVKTDPVQQKLSLLTALGDSAYPAPLWDYVDPELQGRVEHAVDDLGLSGQVRHKKLSVALVDITDRSHPRVAELNGDVMMYAASLPKIAVLLAACEKAAAGQIRLDGKIQHELEQMIRYSSNTSATYMMHTVGKEYIADVMMSPRYRLYDPSHNGGLWVGKDYASSGVWRRDPLHNLSHGATAMQVARFYYLLETGRLVSPEYSRVMKRILSETMVPTKFAKGLSGTRPYAQIYRKSGTWRTYHSDSALVEHDGRTYIAAALSDNPAGAEWLSQLIVSLDRVILATTPYSDYQVQAASASPSPAPVGTPTQARTTPAPIHVRHVSPRDGAPGHPVRWERWSTQ